MPYLTGSQVKYRKTNKEKDAKLIDAKIQGYNCQADTYRITYENDGEIIATTVVAGSLLPPNAQPVPKPKRLPWF